MSASVPAKPARSRPPARSVCWRAGIAACLAAFLLSACAGVPDGGPATPGRLAGAVLGQAQDYPQLIPVPPRQGWHPVQIVSGFLAASASFANDHAVAREYLAPPQLLSHPWHPGWAVTVVTATQLTQTNVSPHQAGPAAQSQSAQVLATGQQLAALTQTGQYVGTKPAASPPADVHFQLIKVNGQWRITNPPDQLLLTQTDFQGVYAQRNLYFLADSGHALVPDPVFVPQQASPVDLAKQLVTALLTNPQGWLESAARTAFPYAKTLQVSIDAGTVTVDLGGSASATGKARLGEMTSQLIWTLASGLPAVQAVHLEINGQPGGSATWSGGQPQQTGGQSVTVPVEPPGTSLYSIGAGGAVQELTGSLSLAVRVPGEAGQGHVALTTIAVSPGGQYVAGFTKTGDQLYYAALRRGAKFSVWSQAGGFTSVSWDASDNLWAAGPRGVWEIPPGGSPIAVSLGNSLQGYEVRQFRVALDGVRVAMITSSPNGGGATLRIGAIVRAGGQVSVGQAGPLESIGADISNPDTLTWYDAENLLVLEKSSTLGPELQEVPVNGGSSTSLTTDIDTVSISAAGPVNKIVAGLSRGQIATTSVVNGTWTTTTGAGSSPTYPG